MISLRSIAGKLLLLPLAIGNFLLFVAALAVAITWCFIELVTVESPDPWDNLLISFLTFSRRVSVTFLVFGGITWFLRRRKNRIPSVRLNAKGENLTPWVLTVTVVLLVHTYLALLYSRPLLPLLQENLTILQKLGVWDGLLRGGDFSGIFLVPVFAAFLPTGLGAVTTLAFIAAAPAFLGYLLLGLEDYARLLLRCICLQVAFLLSLFFTLTLLESGIHFATQHFITPDTLELKAQLLHWLSRKVDLFTRIANHLAFLLPGFLVCEAALFWKGNGKERTGIERQMQLAKEMQSPEQTQTPIPGIFVETDERFQHEEYSIKYRFLSNPLYKVFDIYDSNSELAFTARMNTLGPFSRLISVYSADKEGTETLRISGRRIVLFPNIFDVTYCPTHKKVGILKHSPSGWAIVDEYGRTSYLKLEGSWGSVKGQIMAGELSACKYIFLNLIRPMITIRFNDDSAIILDKKLGIGLALVLGFQSVAFNQVYSTDVSI